MSEYTKTFIFAGAAMAVVLIAYLSKPRPAFLSGDIAADIKVLNEGADPLATKRIEITTFDEATSSLKQFEVAEVNGVWSIPSYKNYPADADPKRRLGPAASSVVNLKVLGVQSTNVGDQETYGVVEPDPAKLSAGATGVGTLVVLKDAKDADMANLIVGKAVKDSPEQRYVRKVNQDPIYVVKLDASLLSTKFEDWIEADLLKLNAFDIQRVEISDYTVQPVQTSRGIGFQPDLRSEIVARYADSSQAWTLESLKTFNETSGRYETVKLASGDQPNADKLNAMKTALDDLKIVGVERKPAGLSKTLQADQSFLSDNAAVQSMFDRGFFPDVLSGNPDSDKFEVMSKEGQVICQMKDGVEYVLRFGEIAGVEKPADAADAAAATDEEEKAQASKSAGLNRYLLVMARFNQDAIPKPELVDLPVLPGEMNHPSPATPDDNSATPDDNSATPDDSAAPPVQQGAGSSEMAGQDWQSVALLQDNQPPVDAPAGAQPAVPAAPAAPEPGGDGQSGLGALIGQPPADLTGQGAQTPLTDKEREDIKVENQRKLDEYNEKVTDGKKRVEDLNKRFGDWYYIISDSVYQEIHLGRDDVIKVDENAPSVIGTVHELEHDPDLTGAAH